MSLFQILTVSHRHDRTCQSTECSKCLEGTSGAHNVRAPFPQDTCLESDRGESENCRDVERRGPAPPWAQGKPDMFSPFVCVQKGSLGTGATLRWACGRTWRVLLPSPGGHCAVN